MRVVRHVPGMMGLERTHVRIMEARNRKFPEADCEGGKVQEKGRFIAEISCLLYGYLAGDRGDGRVLIVWGQIWSFPLHTNTCT